MPAESREKKAQNKNPLGGKKAHGKKNNEERVVTPLYHLKIAHWCSRECMQCRSILLQFKMIMRYPKVDAQLANYIEPW